MPACHLTYLPSTQTYPKSASEAVNNLATSFKDLFLLNNAFYKPRDSLLLELYFTNWPKKLSKIFSEWIIEYLIEVRLKGWWHIIFVPKHGFDVDRDYRVNFWGFFLNRQPTTWIESLKIGGDQDSLQGIFRNYWRGEFIAELLYRRISVSLSHMLNTIHQFRLNAKNNRKILRFFS